MSHQERSRGDTTEQQNGGIDWEARLYAPWTSTNANKWVAHSEEELTLRHCGYWVSLRGMPETTDASQTVLLPKQQQFNVEALQAIMARIGAGDLP